MATTMGMMDAGCSTATGQWSFAPISQILRLGQRVSSHPLTLPLLLLLVAKHNLVFASRPSWKPEPAQHLDLAWSFAWVGLLGLIVGSGRFGWVVVSGFEYLNRSKSYLAFSCRILLCACSVPRTDLHFCPSLFVVDFD